MKHLTIKFKDNTVKKERSSAMQKGKFMFKREAANNQSCELPIMNRKLSHVGSSLTGRRFLIIFQSTASRLLNNNREEKESKQTRKEEKRVKTTAIRRRV